MEDGNWKMEIGRWKTGVAIRFASGRGRAIAGRKRLKMGGILERMGAGLNGTYLTRFLPRIVQRHADESILRLIGYCFSFAPSYPAPHNVCMDVSHSPKSRRSRAFGILICLSVLFCSLTVALKAADSDYFMLQLGNEWTFDSAF